MNPVSVNSINPITGEPASAAPATTAEELAASARSGQRAFATWSSYSRLERADVLDRIARGIESERAKLVEIADVETALGTTRLDGEVDRASNQFRLFAKVLRDGHYLDAAIDHATDTPPQPELRRINIPIGPVAVFGASNFPFAFSVLGGDVASALAAGCPVLVKLHDAHLGTAELSVRILREAFEGIDPDIVLPVVGTAAGALLVQQPEIRAVAFTGSYGGGLALMRLAESRQDRIPFYAEMSGLNPVFVSPDVARERGEEFARGLVNSVTLGGGQFCTKPGVVLVPDDEAGDALVAAVESNIAATSGFTLLSERICDSYRSELGESKHHSHQTVGTSDPKIHLGAPAAVTVDRAESSNPAEIAECFGPAVALLRYRTTDEALDFLSRLQPSLTGTIHATDSEVELANEVQDVMQPTCGRLVFNGFPTGVRVSWAQTHHGPWPASSGLITAVGASAISRFVRPFTWQDAPHAVLPPELQDGPVDVPRRVDGVFNDPEAPTREGD